MTQTLAVCPTCAWPILAEIGQCVRCRPFVTPDPVEEATDDIDAEIARNVTGQMPSMAVFRETQQVSAAEKQSELAWLQAQQAVAQRRSRTPVRRVPIRVIAVVVAIAVVGAFFVLRGGGSSEPGLTTPVNDLPWRGVTFDGGSVVQLPGEPITSSTSSEIGGGTRTAASVPGVTISVAAYRGDYGMRGAGAATVDLLKARAGELGDKNASGGIKQNRDRWGEAFDLTVMAEGTITRLRAIVVGATVYVIEVAGPQTTRTGQIFSRVVNTLVPKQSAST